MGKTSNVYTVHKTTKKLCTNLLAAGFMEYAATATGNKLLEHVLKWY